MHACCAVLCCVVLCCAHYLFSSFTLFLLCECVCIYYLHVTAEGRCIGSYLTHYTVIPYLTHTVPTVCSVASGGN